MEADARYYWRRAVEEVGAARRSLTGQARERHHHFARLYLERLGHMGAPLPFSAPELEAEMAGMPGREAA
jgi:CelD/BcsL family acetyltransferase involved in cellulose biosynthesis